MATTTGPVHRSVRIRARLRAARSLERGLDRWTSLAFLTVGLAGAAAAVAARFLA